MGVPCKAEDIDLNRFVALKLLPEGMATDDSWFIFAIAREKWRQPDFSTFCGNPPCVPAIRSIARLRWSRPCSVRFGDTAKARSTYHDFFAIWRDADRDFPILQQAKSEYQLLHNWHCSEIRSTVVDACRMDTQPGHLGTRRWQGRALTTSLGSIISKNFGAMVVSW